MFAFWWLFSADWENQKNGVLQRVHVQLCQEERKELLIRETKRPLHKRMTQHKCATSSGQDLAEHLHLKEAGHFFEDRQVRVLAREDHWLERGVKEAINIMLVKTIFKQKWRTKALSITRLQ